MHVTSRHYNGFGSSIRELQYWVAAFYDARGKQHRRTTRETNKKRALKVAEQFEAVAKRQMSAAKVRKTFSEFYRAYYGAELPQATVRSFAEQWLASRKAETSPLSHRVYEIALDKFLACLGPRADHPLDDVARSQVAAFRDAQLAVSAAATTNLTLKVVKMLFRSARRDGFVLEDVAESVNTVKANATFERRPFTIEEVRRIIDVANDEWRSLVLFGLYTGQRLGDIATLKWYQVDLDRDEVRLTTRKTGKPLIVPIALALKEHSLAGIVADDPRAPVHPRGAQERRCEPRPRRRPLKPVWRIARQRRIARSPKQQKSRTLGPTPGAGTHLPLAASHGRVDAQGCWRS